MNIKPVATVAGAQYERPLLSKSVRWGIWVLLIITLMNINFSSGIMASSGKDIKTSMSMMDLEYGCFSAIYAIGRMAGSLLFVILVNAVNRKYLIIASCLLKAITLFIFNFSTDVYFLLAVRLISGVFHIIPVIYAPIWVSQLCIQKSKYVMSSGMSLAMPVGRALGFIWNYYIGGDKWLEGFIFNGYGLVLCGVIYMFIPSIYFSSKLVAVAKKEGDEVLRPSQARVVSIFNIRESEVNERDINVFKKYSVIFTNMVYIFLLLARVVINSINSIFVFWIPTYVTEVLGYNEKGPKTLCYCLMICFGPFTGSFLGSYFTAKVGGYEKKESVLILLIFNAIAMIALTPLGFVDTWWVFLLCCLGFQIGGSAVLPNLNQVLLTSIPQRLKAKGYAIANVVSTFIGGVPSPMFYGLINDRWKDYDKKFSMKCYTVYGYIGLVWIILAAIFRYKQDDKVGKNEPFQGAKKTEVKVQGDPNALDDIQPALTIKKPNENDEENQQELENKN